MVTTPDETTFEMTLPLIEPCSPLEITPTSGAAAPAADQRESDVVEEFAAAGEAEHNAENDG